MRLFVLFGVSLACCELWFVRGQEEAGYTPVALNITGITCSDFIFDGDILYSMDYCHDCMCNDDKVECSYINCGPAITCHEEMIYQFPGGCCPQCKFGCYSEEFGIMEIMDTATSEDGCELCTCFVDERMHCTTEKCLPCEDSHWEDDGSCCGKCDLTTCKIDGVVYNNYDDIPQEDPCTTCYCFANGHQKVEAVCDTQYCLPCMGPVRSEVKDDGTCCGKCIPQDCFHNDQIFDRDVVIPSEDPCEACICEMTEGGATKSCVFTDCAPCQGKIINDDSCCGQCIPGCNVKGQFFDIGLEVPTKELCETCICGLAESGQPEVKCHAFVCAIKCPEGFEKVYNDSSCCGYCKLIPTPACDPKQCPEINCRSIMQLQLPEMCCPQCKCKYGKETVNPGPFGDVCDGCVCDGFGEVTCNPVDCPKKESLECVDAVKGEDCCYHCPNGKTCAHPRKPNLVIKYGEYMKVDGAYCTCAGEPWFPTAFCTRSRKTRGLQRARKRFGDKLADYMKL